MRKKMPAKAKSIIINTALGIGIGFLTLPFKPVSSGAPNLFHRC